MPPACGPVSSVSFRLDPSENMADRSTVDTIQPTEIDERTINTIRFLAVDAVEQAQSGHPGMPMGAAPMAYVLFTRHLRHNPSNPHWVDRDRFVLSAGHGSMLLYALLHLSGYDLSMDEIKNFRQWGSITKPPASKPRQGRWDRALPTVWGWPSPSVTFRPRSTPARTT